MGINGLKYSDLVYTRYSQIEIRVLQNRSGISQLPNVSRLLHVCNRV